MTPEAEKNLRERLDLTRKIGRLTAGQYGVAVYPCSGWDFLTIAALSENLGIRKVVTIDWLDMVKVSDFLLDSAGRLGRIENESTDVTKIRKAIDEMVSAHHGFAWHGDMDAYLAALALFGADEIVSIERTLTKDRKDVAETRVVFRASHLDVRALICRCLLHHKSRRRASSDSLLP